jgi:stage II sporulation protein P
MHAIHTMLCNDCLDTNIKGEKNMKKVLIMLLATVVMFGGILTLAYGSDKGKDVINNSNDDTTKNKKAVDMSYQSSIKASNIVIYNSHVAKKYDYGEKLQQISKNINNKLNGQGLKSIYLDIPECIPQVAYTNSRQSITSKINDYDKSVLLDIERGGFQGGYGGKFGDGIYICVGKLNKNYEKNKQFAEIILNKVKEIDNSIPTEIRIDEPCVYNQDLSDMALLVVIGNYNSPKEKIDNDADVFSRALGLIIKK